MTQKLPARVPAAVAEHMEVFHPHATRRLIEIDQKKTRFVHYTSAEVGLEILRTRKIWMRLACCMDDYSEVAHGLQSLAAAYASDHGTRLKTFLDAKFPGISKEIERQFNAAQNSLRLESFITCVSEHAGESRESEDSFGRLSMWRAFDRGTGVALVISQDPFWSTNTSMGVFTTPVAYLTEIDFAEELGILATTLEAKGAYLDKIGKDWVRAGIFNAFAMSAIATKHPGFYEEREWRVVRLPTHPFPCPFERPTKVIKGVPQQVIAIDLKDDPAQGIVGIEPKAFIERIIIGPTDYPMPVYQAYLRGMADAGIEKPEERLKVSFLPLRASSR